jgi:hypothetical protein
MALNYKDAQYLLRNFPSIKLSYEKKIHKKVFPLDIVLTIPKGKKYFAWFCKFKGKSVCVFLELDNYRKGIKNVNIFNVSFDSKLTINRGTILYGTIFYYKKAKCFNIENIFYSIGKNISNLNQDRKFKIINTIFNDCIKQKIYTSNDIIFGLPVICRKRQEILDNLSTLPYDIYCIQHRSLFNEKNFLNEIITHKKKTNLIFLIKAEISDDIYTLYYKNDNNKLESYKTVLIPNYETSLMMNSLFRNIKENVNLDAIEESDDDEDFENTDIDQYVDLNKGFKFECVYKQNFNSWVPIKNVEKGEVCSKCDIVI